MLTLGAPVYPQENAVYGQMAVTEWNGGANVPATAIFYVGYAAFGPSGAYEKHPRRRDRVEDRRVVAELHAGRRNSGLRWHPV